MTSGPLATSLAGRSEPGRAGSATARVIGPAAPVAGTVRVPGDKSIAHRALFFGALAHGTTRISNLPPNADVTATAQCLGRLGVAIERSGPVLAVQGRGGQFKPDAATLDCANSGTSMRVLMGLLAAHAHPTRLVGDASLTRRPMERVAVPLRLMGAEVSLAGGGTAPVDMIGAGDPRPLDYAIPVDSAQLRTALIFAGLRARGTSRLTGKLGGRDHTERMAPHFGAVLRATATGLEIEGGAPLAAFDVVVPGDPSSAAFWLAAAAIVPGSAVTVADVGLNPTRLGFFAALQRMGADIAYVPDPGTGELGRPEPVGRISGRFAPLRGTSVGGAEVPDLIDELPLLAVVASQAEGRTEVRGAAELRRKESDRIETLAAGLRAMGAVIETFEDGFAIEGPQPLRGARIDPAGDHRIAMAFAIAGLAARGETMIEDPDCAAVSYPGFFEQLRALSRA